MQSTTAAFSASIVTTPQDLACCFELRHTVYCERLGLEPKKANRQESDSFDNRSIHLGLYAASTDIQTPQPCAYLRLILASADNSKADLTLPFEQVYAQRPGPLKKFRELSGAADAFEISRICKRENTPAAGVIHLQFCALSLAQTMGYSGAVILAEPAYANKLQRVGISIDQIGPETDYHGRRSGYWLPVQQDEFTRRCPELQAAARHDMQFSLRKLALPTCPL